MFASRLRTQLMQMLQEALPKDVRPYSLKLSNTNAASQVVTSVILRGENTVVTGSRDCSVSPHGESLVAFSQS